jgi:hypothetical protein
LTDGTFNNKGVADWVIHDLYTKAIEIETSSLYVSQKAARATAKGIQRQIAAVEVSREPAVESINAIRDNMRAQNNGARQFNGKPAREEQKLTLERQSETAIVSARG